ncbi:MAG: protein kinase, partial [Chloroflexi bacterium]|nr:protein kinase [Chloroflexota bacterium]
AMGVVYRAFDPQRQQTVALKLLAPHLAHDEKALARFQREASSVANLQHPHIAVFYELGAHEERPFIVMEWVAGRTLKTALVEDGSISILRCQKMLKQLADALDHAHANGVVHRDLKPANIMVGADDRVTIVDFGVAWLEASPTITATGIILGTPLYMSPEQIKGQAMNGRSDQYSLAIIVYEMLTGQPPFNVTSTPALYQQHLFEPPIPLSQHNRAFPKSLEFALNKALAKAPSGRFETVADFSDAMHDTTIIHGKVQFEPQPRHKAWLTHRDENGEQQRWFLQAETILIGRYDPADLVWDVPRMSRQHAQIERQELGYFLVDLNSRNGSFVNGELVDNEPRRLQDGDEIVFGGVASFRFHDPEETRAGPKLGRLRGVWVDPELHTIWVDAQLVDPPLSAAQFTLLMVLYDRVGQIVSRGEIITAVWPDTDSSGVSNEAVDGLIKRLRKRLREYSKAQEYLQVVRGRGIRLIQPE